MSGKKGCKYGEEIELRRGPWTLEEDNLLIRYIACHGEGRWNLLARCSGLKRIGKSCRLRWLNYLKPDVKRGNLTPEEQILILELHARWGNRWSRIAQHLPGRTDNEIKNYWRTRVQKQAKQLKIDANSTLFRDAVRCFWMPRLIEKMGTSTQIESTNQVVNPQSQIPQAMMTSESLIPMTTRSTFDDNTFYNDLPFNSCSPSISSDAMVIPQWPTTSQFTSNPLNYHDQIDTTPYNPLNYDFTGLAGGLENQELLPIERLQQGVVSNSISECSAMDNYCMNNNNNTIGEGLWSMDELWQVRKLHEWGI